jgi:hypothetical protein
VGSPTAGPAFGRPDDKLRDAHPLQWMTLTGFEGLDPSYALISPVTGRLQLEQLGVATGL